MHPKFFGFENVWKDHEFIGSSHPETLERLTAIHIRFPELSLPLFWRGLILMRQGNDAEAFTLMHRASEMEEHRNWQIIGRCQEVLRRLSQKQRSGLTFSVETELQRFVSLSQAAPPPAGVRLEGMT
jgi:hypothetical protein